MPILQNCSGLLKFAPSNAYMLTNFCTPENLLTVGEKNVTIFRAPSRVRDAERKGVVVVPPDRCSPFKILCKADLIRLEIFAQVCNL